MSVNKKYNQNGGLLSLTSGTLATTMDVPFTLWKKGVEPNCTTNTEEEVKVYSKPLKVIEYTPTKEYEDTFHIDSAHDALCWTLEPPTAFDDDKLFLPEIVRQFDAGMTIKDLKSQQLSNTGIDVNPLLCCEGKIRDIAKGKFLPTGINGILDQAHSPTINGYGANKDGWVSELKKANKEPIWDKKYGWGTKAVTPRIFLQNSYLYNGDIILFNLLRYEFIKHNLGETPPSPLPDALAPTAEPHDVAPTANPVFWRDFSAINTPIELRARHLFNFIGVWKTILKQVSHEWNNGQLYRNINCDDDSRIENNTGRWTDTDDPNYNYNLFMIAIEILSKIDWIGFEYKPNKKPNPVIGTVDKSSSPVFKYDNKPIFWDLPNEPIPTNNFDDVLKANWDGANNETKITELASSLDYSSAVFKVKGENQLYAWDTTQRKLAKSIIETSKNFPLYNPNIDPVTDEQGVPELLPSTDIPVISDNVRPREGSANTRVDDCSVGLDRHIIATLKDMKDEIKINGDALSEEPNNVTRTIIIIKIKRYCYQILKFQGDTSHMVIDDLYELAIGGQAASDKFNRRIHLKERPMTVRALNAEKEFVLEMGFAALVSKGFTDLPKDHGYHYIPESEDVKNAKLLGKILSKLKDLESIDNIPELIQDITSQLNHRYYFLNRQQQFNRIKMIGTQRHNDYPFVIAHNALVYEGIDNPGVTRVREYIKSLIDNEDNEELLNLYDLCQIHDQLKVYDNTTALKRVLKNIKKSFTERGKQVVFTDSVFITKFGGRKSRILPVKAGLDCIAKLFKRRDTNMADDIFKFFNTGYSSYIESNKFLVLYLESLKATNLPPSSFLTGSVSDLPPPPPSPPVRSISEPLARVSTAHTVDDAITFDDASTFYGAITFDGATESLKESIKSLKESIKSILSSIKGTIDDDFKKWVRNTNLNPLLRKTNTDVTTGGIDNDILSNGLTDIIEEEIGEPEEPEDDSTSSKKKKSRRKKSLEQYLDLIPMLSSYINNVYEFMNTVKNMEGGTYDQDMDASREKEIVWLSNYFSVDNDILIEMGKAQGVEATSPNAPMDLTTTGNQLKEKGRIRKRGEEADEEDVKEVQTKKLLKLETDGDEVQAMKWQSLENTSVHIVPTNASLPTPTFFGLTPPHAPMDLTTTEEIEEDLMEEVISKSILTGIQLTVATKVGELDSESYEYRGAVIEAMAVVNEAKTNDEKGTEPQRKRRRGREDTSEDEYAEAEAADVMYEGAAVARAEAAGVVAEKAKAAAEEAKAAAEDAKAAAVALVAEVKTAAELASAARSGRKRPREMLQQQAETEAEAAEAWVAAAEAWVAAAVAWVAEVKTEEARAVAQEASAVAQEAWTATAEAWTAAEEANKAAQDSDSDSEDDAKDDGMDVVESVSDSGAKAAAEEAQKAKAAEQEAWDAVEVVYEEETQAKAAAEEAREAAAQAQAQAQAQAIGTKAAADAWAQAQVAAEEAEAKGAAAEEAIDRAAQAEEVATAVTAEAQAAAKDAAAQAEAEAEANATRETVKEPEKKMSSEKRKVIELNKKKEEEEEKEALELMKKSYEKIDSKLNDIKISNGGVTNIYYYALEQIKIKKRIYELNLELQRMNEPSEISINLTGNVPIGTKEIQMALIDYITKNINEEVDTRMNYANLTNIFELIKNYLLDDDHNFFENIEVNLEQLEALVHLCGIILKEQYITTITECIKSKYQDETKTRPTRFFDFVIPIMFPYHNYKPEYSDELNSLLTDDYSDHIDTKQLLLNLLTRQIDIINMKKTLYKYLKYHQYNKQLQDIGTAKPDIFIPLTVEQINVTIAKLTQSGKGAAATTAAAAPAYSNENDMKTNSTKPSFLNLFVDLTEKKANKTRGGANKTRKKSKSSQLRKTIKKQRAKKIKRKSLRRKKPIKKRVNSKNRKVKRKIKNKTKKYKKPKKQKRSRKPKPKP